MKKRLLLTFLVLQSVAIFSQEKRKRITGKIFLNEDIISDVHIINKNSNQGTTTNDFGLFEIPVSIGDILEFSHINLKKEKLIVTKELLEQDVLKIDLQNKTYELDEITLEKPKSIFYVDPEIMPHPTVNAKTLNLPYANVRAKKDSKIGKISLTSASVNLDNLLNAINGTNKRKKQLKKISYEDSILSQIRKYFTDDFFITDLSIKQENINLFLNYCFKKNIINHFNKKDNLKLTKILIEESKTFQKDNIEISLLEKN